MITSSSNGQIKSIIQLNNKGKARRESGLFVVEGIKMYREAPRDWIYKVYISQSLWEKDGWEMELAQVSHEVVSDSVFRQMSDTRTPQGILTLVKQPSHKKEKLMDRENPLLVVAEDVQDPGNMGTILRTAEGAGADGIFLSRGCVDIFNPKTIRSTMGSVYRMPFVYVEDMEELMKELAKRNICTYAAHLNGKNFYDGEDYTGGTAFLIGNEGNGLSPQISRAAWCLIRIPMEGKVESLNAAMACGILLYEASRQRRKKDVTKQVLNSYE